jgi:predicted metal-binding membrane protein
MSSTALVACVLALVVLAWVTTLVLPATPVGAAMSHGYGGALGEGAAGLLLLSFGLFLVAWVVMTAAMMLPTALPMVLTFGRLVQARPDGTRRVTFFVLGYLAAWAGFGAVAYNFDLQIHAAVHLSPFLASHTELISGGVLLLAGVYQFTPLKARCLRLCRSTLGYLMDSWRDGWTGAWRMGLRHGIFCVGCCWALMLVMFALGMAQLGWMLGLTFLMFVEKVAWRGELVGRAAGPLFVLAGLAAVLGFIHPASM